MELPTEERCKAPIHGGLAKALRPSFTLSVFLPIDMVVALQSLYTGCFVNTPLFARNRIKCPDLKRSHIGQPPVQGVGSVSPKYTYVRN